MASTIKYILTAKILSAALGLALAACSSGADVDAPEESTSTRIMLNPEGDGVVGWEAVTSSRAVGDPLEADTIQSVGLFAVNDATSGVDAGLVFNNQQFYNRRASLFLNDPVLRSQAAAWPVDNYWPYFPQRGWIGGARYVFLAYAPYYPSGIAVTTTGDSEIAELVWEGLSSISAADHLLSNCESYLAIDAANPAKHLDMQHLMARLRFCFQLGDSYSDLRKIVVKEMAVDYPDSRAMTLTVTFTPTAAGYEQTPRWDRDEPGTGTTYVALRNEADVDSITLAKGLPYQALASLYYEPGDPLSHFNIQVTYDVYDTHNKLLRKNDTALSAITMSRKVEAGSFYDVKIKIEPSYLYVLSDEEPDTDGALIIP